MRKKRAVSPLIATVLLIGFAITLGAIVSTFVIKQTKDFKPESFLEESPYCDGATLEPFAVNSRNPVRATSAGPTRTLENFGLKNKGSFNVLSVIVKAPGNPAATSIIFNPPLRPQTNSPALTIQYNSNAARNDPFIKFIPVVEDREETERRRSQALVACAKREITFNLADPNQCNGCI